MGTHNAQLQLTFNIFNAFTECRMHPENPKIRKFMGYFTYQCLHCLVLLITLMLNYLRAKMDLFQSTWTILFWTETIWMHCNAGARSLNYSNISTTKPSQANNTHIRLLVTLVLVILVLDNSHHAKDPGSMSRVLCMMTMILVSQYNQIQHHRFIVTYDPSFQISEV